ncbi:MAG: GNAT family N-acetyltransferase [Actinomycetota bacterium]|nr:GNAT family N-acetyltransferase [Actinomycetota bacterium]
MTWTSRPCTPDDASAVLALFAAHDAVEFGGTEMEADEVAQTLAGEGPSWVALDGRPVGFAHVQPGGDCDTVVDPDYDPALRPALVVELVERARELGVGRLEHWAGPGMRLTGPALAPHGFRHARTSWHLRRELTHLPGPQWPDGVGLSPFRAERDARQVWALVTEAFAGTSFGRARTFKEWSRLLLAGNEVLTARRGQTLVGCATHGIRFGEGYVGQLAVSPAERGKGLGRALLLEVFRMDATGGRRGTRLIVDGANVSARRLYDGVGMEVTNEYWRWDLDLPS